MEETHKNMLEKVEKWGDSVEAAVKLALNDLKLTRDEVDVEVLEQPTRGFFGFLSFILFTDLLYEIC